MSRRGRRIDLDALQRALDYEVMPDVYRRTVGVPHLYIYGDEKLWRTDGPTIAAITRMLGPERVYELTPGGDTPAEREFGRMYGREIEVEIVPDRIIPERLSMWREPLFGRPDLTVLGESTVLKFVLEVLKSV